MKSVNKKELVRLIRDIAPECVYFYDGSQNVSRSGWPDMKKVKQH